MEKSIYKFWDLLYVTIHGLKSIFGHAAHDLVPFAGLPLCCKQYVAALVYTCDWTATHHSTHGLSDNNAHVTIRATT